MLDPFEDDQYCWEMSLDRDGDELEAEGQARMDPTNLHEFVKASQQKRASKVAEANPSTVSDVYWLYARAPQRHRYPAPNDRSGKWLVFCKPEDIDDTWRVIKRAVERGKLGRTAKCSTRLGFREPDFVICVYTYDWKDNDDVYRIRETLRELGVEKPIPYKSDADTIARRYATDPETKGKIAKYYN